MGSATATQRSRILNNRGIISICNGNVYQALADLRQCVLLDPDNNDAQFNLTCLLLRQHDDAAACVQWLTHRKFDLDCSKDYYENIGSVAAYQVAQNCQGLIKQHVTGVDEVTRQRQEFLMDRTIARKWITIRKQKSIQSAIQFTKEYIKNRQNRNIPL